MLDWDSRLSGQSRSSSGSEKAKKDFREMTNLPEVFKEKLSEKCRIGGVETAAVQKSVKDGTRKYLSGWKTAILSRACS